MEVSLQQFVAQLTNTGVMTSQEVSTFIERTGASLTSAEELAAAMIAAEKLTPFQSQHVRKANAEQLVIGDYLLLDVVGSGGMGQVYRARHRQTGELEALKILPSNQLQSPTALKRFEREMEIACEVRHPHVAQIRDGDASGLRPWFAMEFVPGTDLQHYVEEHGPLNLDTAIGFIEQVAQGLESLHERGIIHRDIKPSNLILTPEGTIKLVDFGLARQDPDATDSPDEQFTMLTESWAAMGTVDYMAPEQAHDARSVDQRADLYSLGCTLYFLVHGRPPFRGETDVETLLAHSEGKIPRLTTDRSRRGQALNHGFRQLLAKNTEQRLQSAGAFIESLSARDNSPSRNILKQFSYVTVLCLAVGLTWYFLAGPERGNPSTTSIFDAPSAPADLSQYELLIAIDGELFRMDLADRTLRPFVASGLAGDKGYWSHDGSRIIFRKIKDGKKKDMHMIHPDGSGSVPLRTWGMDFSWSPDDRHIAFSKWVKGSADLWVVDQDGTNPRTLIDFEHAVNHPAWSPDGEWIAFVAEPPNAASQIQIVRPDGSDLQDLPVPKGSFWPAWYPDGKALACRRAKNGGEQIFLYTLQNSSSQQLTHDGFNMKCCWSPDGRYLAYVYLTPTDHDSWKEGTLGEIRVYDMQLDRSETILKCRVANDETSLSWKPFSVTLDPVALR